MGFVVEFARVLVLLSSKKSKALFFKTRDNFVAKYHFCVSSSRTLSISIM